MDQLRGGVPLGKYNSLGDFEIDLESMTLNASCSENAGEELYVPSDLFRFLCSCAPSIQRQLERFLGSGEHLLRLIACSSILSTARNGQPFVSVNTFSASLPEFSLQKSLDMWRSCDNVMRALVRFVRDSRLRVCLYFYLSLFVCKFSHLKHVCSYPQVLVRSTSVFLLNLVICVLTLNSILFGWNCRS